MVQENILKGRIAEAIVKCMMQDLGFKVIPYGYENTCPEIANPNNVIDGDIKQIIRQTPDFIIIDKNNKAHFLDVKFRADGCFKKNKDYPYPMAHVILLTGDGYIGVEQYGKLNDEAKLNGDYISNDFNILPNYILFKDATKGIVSEYIALLRKYMGNTKN